MVCQILRGQKANGIVPALKLTTQAGEAESKPTQCESLMGTWRECWGGTPHGLEWGG